MSLRVLAIGIPDTNSDMLFFTLEALGLSAQTMAHHELFTTAGSFNQNIRGESNFDATSQAYQVLNRVEDHQFLPGFIFYARAGATLLQQMQFKKILMVRDPRDIIVGSFLENSKPGSPFSEYYQSLPGDTERLKITISGFVADQTKFPGVALENAYKRLRYFTLWTNEPDTLVIRYEDLLDESQTGPEAVSLATLKRISEWLGLERSPEQLKKSVDYLAARSWHRPASVRTGSWKEYFTSELAPFYRKFVGSFLRKFHYEVSPEWVLPAIPPPVIAITLPKGGTHLLDKALRELGLQSTMTLPMDLHRQLNSADPQAQELMAGVQPGEYILSHLFYNWNVAELLERLEFKKILVIRDPHDVIVSYIRYVQAAEPQEAHYFLNLPDDDTRLLEAIRGVPFIGVKNVGESLNGILKWLEKSDCLLIRFEDLIGAKGQGSRERQLDTIKRICHYLELDATPQEIARVAGEVFDPGALTFREGQIGTWQRYFKPQHHQAFNKLLDDSIEQFGYKKYQPMGNLPATLPYPVLAITYPGAGLYLLDVVLDTLGLGRQFIIPPYPLSRPAEPDRAVPLDMLTMHRHTYAAVQDLLEEVKNNRYALGYIPFSETGLNIVNRLGFKKIVMGRDRRDAAVALARSLPGSDYPVSGYLRQLPDDAARLMATIKGVTVLESGNAQAFLLSNGELFQHLARWSRQPDTMVVDYADLVGEAGGGSQTRQKAALTEICKYLGIEGNPGYIDFAVSSINQRATPPVIEGAINQWETHFSLQHLRAIE